MILEEVLEQAADARPGYELASFKEAGLPVYVLTVRVLTQDRKALSPIEEGVLKAVSAGLDSPEHLAEFLGLPRKVLTPVFAQLNTLELINYVRATGESTPKVLLTQKGKIVLLEAAVIIPQEQTVRICFDALTKRLLVLPLNSLDKPRDMKERGIYEIPAGASKKPEIEDLSMEDFDRVLARQSGGRNRTGDLLAVRRIERRSLNYLPCVMLFYRNIAQPGEIDVAFWREDGPSLDHESRFRELGGHQLVGTQFLSNGRTEITPEVAAQVAEYSPGPNAVEPVLIQKKIAAPTLASSEHSEVDPRVSADGSGDTIQSISCHEHPGLLKKALLHSTKRLLIISPWIRHQVVDYGFVSSLDALLRRGVEVSIGYGLDDGDAGAKGKDTAKSKLPITPQAEKELKQLALRHKNFKFVFIGNTHRKTLISDDSFAVVTSFNWLSFKGDPRDKPRDEGGVVIRKKAYVDLEFAKATDLLMHGYKGA